MLNFGADRMNDHAASGAFHQILQGRESWAWSVSCDTPVKIAQAHLSISAIILESLATYIDLISRDSSKIASRQLSPDTES